MSFPSIIAIVALLSFMAGGSISWKVQNWRHDAEKAAQLQEVQRLAERRATVSDKSGQANVAAEAKVRTITKTIIREVPVYVSANDCPMSPGFRVLHDAAAAGELPDPARIPDAAPVTPPVLAETVADNYGTCRETAQRLIDLQGWVRSQQGVK